MSKYVRISFKRTGHTTGHSAMIAMVRTDVKDLMVKIPKAAMVRFFGVEAADWVVNDINVISAEEEHRSEDEGDMEIFAAEEEM